MKIELIEIDKITPYINNPRKNQNIDKVASSIKEFGFQQPLVVDKSMTIIVGHTRYEASKKLELKKVPVTIADLTPLQAKAYRIADNRVNQDSEWDFPLLNIEFTDLLDNHYELDNLGFDNKELENLITNNSTGLTDEDEVPEKPKKAKTKLGELYQLGSHKLLCGDATNKEDIEKLFQKETIDLLLTDPPYGVDYSQKNEFLNKYDKGNRIQTDIKNDNINDIKQFCINFLSIIPFSDYNIFYIFFAGLQLHHLREAIEVSNLKFSQYLIWNKNNHILGRQDYLNKHEFILYGWKNRHKFYGTKSNKSVIDFDKNLKNDLHPTMKPVGLLELLLKDGSLSNQNVYDPFLGSGSTLIACEKLNRKCYGMELDPIYCDVIIKRWEDYTGQKAKKI
jgi:site-specific DNA-methyltransferase (adenine-specific)